MYRVCLTSYPRRRRLAVRCDLNKSAESSASAPYSSCVVGGRMRTATRTRPDVDGAWIVLLEDDGAHGYLPRCRRRARAAPGTVAGAGRHRVTATRAASSRRIPPRMMRRCRRRGGGGIGGVSVPVRVPRHAPELHGGFHVKQLVRRYRRGLSRGGVPGRVTGVPSEAAAMMAVLSSFVGAVPEGVGGLWRRGVEVARRAPLLHAPSLVRRGRRHRCLLGGERCARRL